MQHVFVAMCRANRRRGVALSSLLRKNGRVVYVLSRNDVVRRNALHHRFPDGTYVAVSGDESGKEFALYIVRD